jgi:hypothetical protein
MVQLDAGQYTNRFIRECPTASHGIQHSAVPVLIKQHVVLQQKYPRGVCARK